MTNANISPCLLSHVFYSSSVLDLQILLCESYKLKADLTILPLVVWFSGLSHEPQARQLDSQAERKPELQVRSPVEGVHERGNHTLMFLSFSLSSPLSKNKINRILKKKKRKEKKADLSIFTRKVK